MLVIHFVAVLRTHNSIRFYAYLCIIAELTLVAFAVPQSSTRQNVAVSVVVPLTWNYILWIVNSFPGTSSLRCFLTLELMVLF